MFNFGLIEEVKKEYEKTKKEYEENYKIVEEKCQDLYEEKIKAKKILEIYETYMKKLRNKPFEIEKK